MPIDLNKIKEELENMSDLGFTVIKPKYGQDKDHPIENKLKLLSWPPTGGSLAKRIYKHYGLGAGGRQQALCPKSFGMKNECPICNWVDTATRSDDPTLVAKIKDIRQNERYMQLCIDWSHFENEKDDSKRMKLGIYDCPPNIHRIIMQEMASQEYDFTAWESALVSLVCYNRGPGVPKSVEFKVTMKQMKPQVVELNPEDWLPLVPDLDSIFTSPSPAELQKLLTGEESSEEEAEETDAKVESEKEEEKPEEKPKLSNRKNEKETEKETEKEEEKPTPVKEKVSLNELIRRAQAASKKPEKPF